jgi:hypothetical protein
VDLLNAHHSGAGSGTVKKFRSVRELRYYTLNNNGKVFPKEQAYEGGILKWLLREISGVYEGKENVKRGRRNEREIH